MNDLIVVDAEKCIKDGLCIADCPLQILIAGEDGIPAALKGAEAACIDCGHCVAVCPTDAIRQRKMTPEQCRETASGSQWEPDRVAMFLNSRRSIRQYRKKPVDRSLIEDLIRMADYAPSAKNVQPAKWMVYSGDETVKRLAGLVVDWMRNLQEKNPAVARAMRMDVIIKVWEKGHDRVLRAAPHLIVGYAPAKEQTAPVAITNGIAYMELAAPSLGLGTCWAGYFTTAAQVYDPLKDALELPEGHSVYGAIMMGMPKVSYRRIPTRKPTDITWR